MCNVAVTACLIPQRVWAKILAVPAKASINYCKNKRDTEQQEKKTYVTFFELRNRDIYYICKKRKPPHKLLSLGNSSNAEQYKLKPLKLPQVYKILSANSFISAVKTNGGGGGKKKLRKNSLFFFPKPSP